MRTKSRGETLDALVKRRLRHWGQRPPGVQPHRGNNAWLRGRPTDTYGIVNPFLKLPGSKLLRTLPDGLWLNFGGDYSDPFVDIFAIEACASITNQLDKRSRFAPSTHSLLAVCPVEWLLAPVAPDDPTPRWKITRIIKREPSAPLSIPVREIRVLYGLTNPHYDGFAKHHLPHAHEFFVPMEMLTRERGHEDPSLQALLGRASLSANFFSQEAGEAGR